LAKVIILGKYINFSHTNMLEGKYFEERKEVVRKEVSTEKEGRSRVVSKNSKDM